MESCRRIDIRFIGATFTLFGALFGCSKLTRHVAAEVDVAPAAARLPVGTAQFMTATSANANGRRWQSEQVVWTSSDPSIATVTKAGLVLGVRPGGPVAIFAVGEGLRDSAQITVVPAAISSPLKISALNPRYFTDSTGRAIYLTGAHTWENFQDVTLSDPAERFDWTAYLDFLRHHNHNFTELWRWEQAKWIAGFDSAFVYAPMPYVRPGPGLALDGKPKFDLTKFDQAYFDRMRSRVLEAQQRGIYVSIMLFDGWSIEKKGFAQGNPWRGHPFNRANNISGIDGDPDKDDQGLETHTLQIPSIVKLQDDYVRKVVSTVDDLDNVLYEISNESTGTKASVDWQNHIIAVVKEFETRLGKRHPVGMTALYPNGNDADLFASDADFVSPAGKTGVGSTPPATGKKVLLWDTDHLCGNCGDGAWAWRSFASGVSPVFMDVYDGTYPVTMLPKPDDPRWEDARLNMGYTLAYASRMNLVAMSPHPELCSSHYCLANPAAKGAEYLVYLNGPSSVQVNLGSTPGELTAEWFNPTRARAYGAGRISGGSVRTFEAPDGAQVLYLRSTQ